MLCAVCCVLCVVCACVLCVVSACVLYGGCVLCCVLCVVCCVLSSHPIHPSPCPYPSLSLSLSLCAVLDKDGSGVVEPADIVSVYDASAHPDVVSGRKSKEAVLREFLDSFDVGGEVDGKVTMEEFRNYYANISASIDNEDYFELMIRNAWRISGGEGAAANSANRRVLVTDKDGRQRVEEIKNDLGLKAGDKAGMLARLKAQGVDAAHIELYGGLEDEGGKNAAVGPQGEYNYFITYIRQHSLFL